MPSDGNRRGDRVSWGEGGNNSFVVIISYEMSAKLVD